MRNTDQKKKPNISEASNGAKHGENTHVNRTHTQTKTHTQEKKPPRSRSRLRTLEANRHTNSRKPSQLSSGAQHSPPPQPNPMMRRAAGRRGWGSSPHHPCSLCGFRFWKPCARTQTDRQTRRTRTANHCCPYRLLLRITVSISRISFHEDGEAGVAFLTTCV